MVTWSPMQWGLRYKVIANTILWGCTNRAENPRTASRLKRTLFVPEQGSNRCKSVILQADRRQSPIRYSDRRKGAFRALRYHID
ncbi:hypothetical protein M378DRAFT_173872 [Amanita muscaria Koide BX008]|uniref:Uncharacterized protein n=1 Tax=Amanita muscaria (strain Koide BX008) TaxID=946122 RepID=A0A0C2WES1_AMAMK|nr:hypothetical protein M378DRAFT_173872 [Amanita muscaria Koide BX008]